MIATPRHIAAAAALSTLLAVGAACGNAEVSPERAVRAEAATPTTDTADPVRQSTRVQVPERDSSEQQFLDDLAAFGLPTGMTAATTVEVGIGICRSIADGADTETVLDRIRPLTSAIAAQDPERDTAEVGRAIVDASRAHLCG